MRSAVLAVAVLVLSSSCAIGPERAAFAAELLRRGELEPAHREAVLEGRLVLGMPLEAVRAVMGAPLRVSVQELPGGQVGQVLVYCARSFYMALPVRDRCSSPVLVALEGGRVVAVSGGAW